MDFYSLLLFVGTAAAVLALAVALVVRLGFYRALLVQWVPALAAIAILAVGVAAVQHLFVAHGPKSAEPLDPIAFLPEHPATLVIPAVALVAIGVGRMSKRSR